MQQVVVSGFLEMKSDMQGVGWDLPGIAAGWIFEVAGWAAGGSCGQRVACWRRPGWVRRLVSCWRMGGLGMVGARQRWGLAVDGLVMGKH